MESMSKVKNVTNKVTVHDDKGTIVEELRISYKNRMGKVHNGITLPSNVLFNKVSNTITIKLNKEAVCKNMQDNEGAFDSWALALKNWLSYVNEIVIAWEKPKNISNENYQRFLYRLSKVRNIFPWIKVEKNCEEFLDDLDIKCKDICLVNVPNSESKEEAVKEEARYERLFINEYNKELAKAANMSNSKLYNQLPVGLFKNNINNNSRVFEGFLDIWGIDDARKELNIFELKKPDNYPIGIVSELLFYVMFQKDILDKRFIYKDIDNIKNYRGIHDLINSNYKQINGYFLATKLHPLIDEELMELMNSYLASYNIKINYIKYDVDKGGNIKL